MPYLPILHRKIRKDTTVSWKMKSIKSGYYGRLWDGLNGKFKPLAEFVSLSGMTLLPLLCPRLPSQKRDLWRCGPSNFHAGPCYWAMMACSVLRLLCPCNGFTLCIRRGGNRSINPFSLSPPPCSSLLQRLCVMWSRALCLTQITFTGYVAQTFRRTHELQTSRDRS